MPYTHASSSQKLRKDFADASMKSARAYSEERNERIAQCLKHLALWAVVNEFQEWHQGYHIGARTT